MIMIRFELQKTKDMEDMLLIVATHLTLPAQCRHWGHIWCGDKLHDFTLLWQWFTDYRLDTRHCAKWFILIISFNPCNNLRACALLFFFPILQRNEGSDKWSNFCKLKQLVLVEFEFCPLSLTPEPTLCIPCAPASSSVFWSTGQWMGNETVSKNLDFILLFLWPWADWFFLMISCSLGEHTTMAAIGHLTLGLWHLVLMLRWSQLPSKVLWRFSDRGPSPLATGIPYDSMGERRG
jgi:hypothetical protein